MRSDPCRQTAKQLLTQAAWEWEGRRSLEQVDQIRRSYPRCLVVGQDCRDVFEDDGRGLHADTGHAGHSRRIDLDAPSIAILEAVGEVEAGRLEHEASSHGDVRDAMQGLRPRLHGEPDHDLGQHPARAFRRGHLLRGRGGQGPLADYGRVRRIALNRDESHIPQPSSRRFNVGAFTFGRPN